MGALRAMKTFKQFLKEDLGSSPEKVSLKAGLSKKEAYKAASKKATRDFRGMKYDKETGKCSLQ